MPRIFAFFNIYRSSFDIYNFRLKFKESIRNQIVLLDDIIKRDSEKIGVNIWVPVIESADRTLTPYRPLLGPVFAHP